MAARPDLGAAAGGAPSDREAIATEPLTAAVRRVVRARMGAHPDVDDVVQEALARVLTARDRISPDTLEAYAVTTARNLVATTWRDADRFRRHQHRLIDHDAPPQPVDGVVAGEDREAMQQALAGFEPADRDLLLAHEVQGVSTADLAARLGSTPGAVAARLHRLRSRLRVEYLIHVGGSEPPTDRCRKVLYSLSLADRRRQRETGAEQHTLECEMCRELAPVLRGDDPAQVRIPISTDPDIVAARQAVREVAAELGFAGVDQTVIATAVSELARNIVRFATTGEIVVDTVSDGARQGVRVVARDSGPGIADVDAAMRDGFSTNRGLGLGLPGVRRLSDEFELATQAGSGTTITCITWQRGGPR